jgi:hypothetical protein
MGEGEEVIWEEVIWAAVTSVVILEAGSQEAAPVQALLAACMQDTPPVSEHSLIPCKAIVS